MSDPKNPYRPGAGISPPVLAGRDDQLALFDELLTDVGGTGEGTRPWLVTGTRGVGKTVLLLEYAQRAQDAGWEVASIEAGPPESLARAFVRELFVPLHRALSARADARRVQPRTPAAIALRKVLAAFASFRLQWDTRGTMSFGLEIKPDPDAVAATGDLGADLYELLRALGEWLRTENRAGLITIDELDAALPEDIHGLNKALHLLGQDDLPVPLHVVAAGQQRLPSILAKANAYAERLYVVHQLGPLTPDAARAALTEPAAHLGVTWEEKAVDDVVEISWAVPYFLQAIGREAWELKQGETITRDDAGAATLLAFEDAQSLFRSRWEALTVAQRSLVAALAARGGTATVKEVGEDLGRTPAQLSRPRAELVARGIVVADSGRLRFTLPGFAQFSLRLAHEEGLTDVSPDDRLGR